MLDSLNKLESSILQNGGILVYFKNVLDDEAFDFFLERKEYFEEFEVFQLEELVDGGVGFLLEV